MNQTINFTLYGQEAIAALDSRAERRKVFTWPRVEVEFDRERKRIIPRRFCQVHKCGAKINPDNLRAQVEGSMIMGLSPELCGVMQFRPDLNLLLISG